MAGQPDGLPPLLLAASTLLGFAAALVLAFARLGLGPLRPRLLMATGA